MYNNLPLNITAMKRLLFFIAISGLYLAASSQPITIIPEKEEVYEKAHVKDKKPVPYPQIREADVVWTKTIWRMVDLRHKINMPLYFPTKRIGDRMNLADLLLYGVKNEGLQVYDPDAADATTEFDIVMTPEQVDVAVGNVTDTVYPIMPDGTQSTIPEYIPGRPKIEELQQLLIKEVWYFDRQHSTMRVQIIGLCPVRLYRKGDDPTLRKQKTFWVYYPAARPILANHEIFNRQNDAQRISFDDYFMQRRFEGFIWAESNVYNNRGVNEYTTGMQSLWESERIQHELFRIEHDMWEY
jgi:gliding motility associated protien GldN